MFKVSQEERQKLLNYLKSQPYEQVFTLIALIVGLKPIEDSKNKKLDNGKDKKDDKKVN